MDKTPSNLCPKCNGVGSYSYDENHGKLCEVCCTHSEGWSLLEEHYGEDNGKLCCIRGCGTTKENDGTGKLPTPKGKWVCFTPSGTYLYETEAPTEKEAWSKLLKEASHMPYDGIEGFKERGYECEFISDSLLPDKTDKHIQIEKPLKHGEKRPLVYLSDDKTDDSLDNILYTFVMDYDGQGLAKAKVFAKFELEALIQAERIKARNEGAYFALREHAGVYTDQITKGEIYRKLVRQIDKELAELDTPKGGETE